MKHLVLVAWVVLSSASLASAGPAGGDERPSRAASEAWEREPAPPTCALELPVRLALVAPRTAGESASVWRWVPAEEDLDAGLRLSVPLTRWLSFELDADLDGLPRLDAIDWETYFSAGLELRATPWLSLFVQDFLPTSAVLGGDDGEVRVPRRSWDGHQVSLGLKAALGPRLELRAEGVAYVGSVRGRPSDGGLRLEARVVF